MGNIICDVLLFFKKRERLILNYFNMCGKDRRFFSFSVLNSKPLKSKGIKVMCVPKEMWSWHFIPNWISFMSGYYLAERHQLILDFSTLCQVYSVQILYSWFEASLMKYCRGPIPSCSKKLSHDISGTSAWISPLQLKPDLVKWNLLKNSPTLLSVEALQP